MTVSLLISTYNSPDYLRLSLDTVLSQTRMPDEILIADDGSGPDTRAVVEEFARRCPVPVRHVWHPDEGFRLAAIRNKAIKAATGDYIIQIDGDMLLHPDFVADHVRYARPGYLSGGSRSILKETSTRRIVRRGHLSASERFLGSRTPLNSLHTLLFTPFWLSHREKEKKAIRGANMAFWRDDALRINGYNEGMTGWGREDSEFAIRLQNAGIRKQWLKFAAVAFHLYHPERSRSSQDANTETMLRALADGTTYIPQGIDRLPDTPFPPL